MSFSKGNGDNNDSEEQNCYDDNIEEEKHCSDDILPIYFRNNIILKRRKKNKILWFVNYKYKTDPENYCWERLMLYTALRKDSVDL